MFKASIILIFHFLYLMLSDFTWITNPYKQIIFLLAGIWKIQLINMVNLVGLKTPWSQGLTFDITKYIVTFQALKANNWWKMIKSFGKWSFNCRFSFWWGLCMILDLDLLILGFIYLYRWETWFFIQIFQNI